MQTIFLVTGNKGKLAEWQRLLPEDITIDSVEVDLAEIQSLDSEEIVADKAKRAYEIVGKPVIVEDVSTGLVKLGGLPGPFIKYFIQSLGQEALYILAGEDGAEAIASCSIAYYDGSNLLSVKGEINGTVVRARGENGFGFDKTFMPAGQNKTYGEMSASEKDQLSHRSKAVKLFTQKLRQHLA